MDPRSWKVAVLADNRFEAQMLIDLLRQVEAAESRILRTGDAALLELVSYPANIIFIALDPSPAAALDWVRLLRRAKTSPCRQSFVFAVTNALTMNTAQQCRAAGVNAVIGKPISGATVANTIKKVLSRPRVFVEGLCYVGPCRRAGIVTAGSGSRRRAEDVRLQV